MGISTSNQAGVSGDGIESGLAASDFLTLTDTPASYASQSLKGVRVNAGETALEFFDIASGLYARVGPVEPYTTYKAAIDAGETKIAVLGDTTETANITMPVNVLTLICDGATLNMGNFQFVSSANTSRYDFMGNGTISCAYTSAKALFDGGASTAGNSLNKSKATP